MALSPASLGLESGSTSCTSGGLQQPPGLRETGHDFNPNEAGESTQCALVLQRPPLLPFEVHRGLILFLPLLFLLSAPLAAILNHYD